MPGKRFAVVGGGTMGIALVRALTRAGLALAEEFCICEALPARADALRREFGLTVTDSLASAVDASDFIYLSVKPQDLSSLENINLNQEQVVVSILAGIPLEQVQSQLKHRRVVRAMPNTPAQVGRGYTVWTAAPSVTGDQRCQVRQLLGAMGEELYVSDERAIDRATAVSGSGPAYIFMITEALTDAAVQIGVSRADARKMVLETIIGSAHYAAAADAHIAELRDQVTSPAGTTAAGLRVLENRGLRAALIEAVAAAYARVEELGSS